MALVLSMYPPVQHAQAEPTPPPPSAPPVDTWVDPTGAGVVRPDAMSAAVTARSSGERVEVLSERTETNRTWALPTGGFESEASSAPVRFRQDDAPNDGWVDIDTTLVRQTDGTVTPRAVPNEVVLGGHGDPAAELVSTEKADGQTVTLGAGVDEPLPNPVLEGSTATYPDVLPGVDVKVEVRPTGFEQLWVAKTRAGLDALLTEQPSGDQGVAAAMTVDDLTASPQADGAVAFANDDNKVVARLAPPIVWDAATTPGGLPAAEGTADFGVATMDGDPVSPRTGATGDLELSVVPDQDWLGDPARQFPVTIDPTYVAGTAQGPIFDTYVKETLTTDASSSSYLPTGMGPDGYKHRSFLTFNTTPFLGKTITSANLALWSDTSGTCTANGWSAYDAGLALTSTRWTAQPTVGTKFATSTQTKGFGAGCDDGEVTIDMKAQVQSWADGAATSKGVALKSDNETSNTYYHRFLSSQAAANQPVLRWSYNRAPAGMSVPSVAGAASYQPSGSSSSYLYTADTQPDVSGIVSDPDGDPVWGKFYAKVNQADSTDASYCMAPAAVASGTRASCDLATALSNNSRYWLRTRGYDSKDFGSYSSWLELRVAATAPAAPVISCPAPYSGGAWQTTAPAADVICTVTAAGAGYTAASAIYYFVDGSPTYTKVDIPQSSSTSVAKTTVTLPRTPGGHSIRAWAKGPTGLGAVSSYHTGWGAVPLLKSPHPANPTMTIFDNVDIAAAGPPQSGSTTPTAKTQWRVAGATGTAGWTDAPAGNNLSVAQVGGQSAATGTFDTSTIVGQADASGVVVNGRVPTLIDVRVCLTLASTPVCSGSTAVQRMVHAFDAGYPTADAGPGQVALWTGELQVDDTDAELSTPGGSLSVARSHTSFTETPSVQNRVFGPGWTASFDSESGGGGAELYDGTTRDGTLAVLDADGAALIYTTPTKARRTTAALPTGTYPPANDNTRIAGATLTVSGTGAATIAELTGDDGVITKFQVTAAPTSAPVTFRTVDVHEPAVSSKTTYSYDTAGRVTAITAPLPDGVTSCTPGTPANGCRVLKIAYAGVTTATASTPGDYANQVKTISAQVNTDTDRQLASYAYDSAGRLIQAADSLTNLTTSYTWTGTGPTLRLASLTPPGLAPYTFLYANDRLARVERPNPATAGGGTAQLAAYVYNLPIAGTVPDLPDLGELVSQWQQVRTPTTGFAVFGPETPISSPPAAGADTWKSADLQFTDPEGYTVNSADYGSGAWQLTATDYDVHDNTIRSWDARAIQGMRDGTLPTGGEAVAAATVTVYNDDIKNANGDVVTPAGTLVTDTYGPVHEVVAADASLKLLRTRTNTNYDEGAPTGGVNPDTGQPYRLPTSVVTTAETAQGDRDAVLTRTITGYDPVVTGDSAGWALGQATTVITDMDLDGSVSSGDIIAKTRYDARGRVIENRQPKSDGTDAGTRLTVYYTGDTSAPVSACNSKPAYAGMVCQTGPAAQPTGKPMPVTRTTNYTWDGDTATQVDTSGTVTSTTTTTFDSASRPQTVTTSVTGQPGSQAVPAVTTSYDPTTGLTNGTTSTAGTTGTGYDTWGRPTAYTNTPAGQTADTATTTYDAAGRVITVIDNNGQTSYGYDGIDAAGNPERRGLVTTVKVKTTGGVEYTSTGAYDTDGDLVLEKLPGNINRRHTIDPAGENIELTVNGQALNPATGQLEADQPWFGWSSRPNANSQTTWEWTTEGTGPHGDLGTTTSRSDRAYKYDRAGRLTQVNDNVGDNPCQTRSYSFDANGNRTSQATTTGPGDGTCTTTGGTTTTRTYDAADRPTTGANGTGAYTYDELGRQTTIPAADTPHPDNGDITLGYYDTDAARTITQDGATTTFTLDGAGRRLGETTTTGDPPNQTLVRHYTDSGDSPTWSIDTTGGNTTSTRYNQLINGDLGLTITTTGANTEVELDLNTLRGDIATTVTLSAAMTGPGQTAATGIDTWTSYTEYGQPQQATTSTPGGVSGIGYGWLGAEERATDADTGLTLMGARIYNPTTGLFTTTDPVYQGGDTIYGYPNDPIQITDLTGEWWGWAWRVVRRFVFRRAMGIYIRRPQHNLRNVIRRCNSFLSGTLVLMADGTTKPIENVELGELVLASDPKTGETAAEEVTDLILGSGLKNLTRVGTDPNADGVTDWITATDGHPFRVPARGWTDAADLTLGDLLVNKDGNLIKVTRLSKSTRNTVVHNLTVDRLHTYYVMAGDQSVLVHNDSCPVHGHGPQGNGRAKEAKHVKGNKRRAQDQKRSNNPNTRRRECNHQWFCPR